MESLIAITHVGLNESKPLIPVMGILLHLGLKLINLGA